MAEAQIQAEQRAWRRPSLGWATQLFGGLLLSLSLAIGCSQGPMSDTALLKLNGVTQSELSPGLPLVIYGTGLPAGREGTVTLTGLVHRPGHEPLEITTQLDAKATHSDRVEAEINEATLMRLGGRGTFRGEARVTFRSRDERTTVSGDIDGLELDLLPSRVAGVHDLERRAYEALGKLGIEILEDAPIGEGLVVATADASTGLVEGDRILALGDVHIDTIADFVPRPSDRVVTLRVAREGISGVTDVELSLDRAATLTRVRPLPVPPLFLAIAFVIVFCFLAPSARVFDTLARVRGPGSLRETLAVLVATIVASATFVLALSQVPIVFVVAFALACSLLVGKTKRGTLARLEVPAVLTLIAMLMLTENGPESVALKPWTWPALTNPIALAAFLVYVLSLGREPITSSWPRRVLAELRVQALVVAGVAVFLGPPDLVRDGLLPTSAIVFGLQCVALRAIGNAPHRYPLAPLAVAICGLSFAWTSVDLPKTVVELGPVAALGVMLAFVFALVRRGQAPVLVTRDL